MEEIMVRYFFYLLILCGNFGAAYALTKNEADLFTAAEKGDVSAVKKTLKKFNKKKDSINAQASEDPIQGGGESALFLAVRGGHLEVVKILLEAKADPTVHLSLGEGSAECLLKSAEGKSEIIDLLIKAGAGHDCVNTNVDTVYALVRDGLLSPDTQRYNTPLLAEAVSAAALAPEKYIGFIKLLIEKKADVNYPVKHSGYPGKTILGIASSGSDAKKDCSKESGEYDKNKCNQYQEIIKLLRAAGAK